MSACSGSNSVDCNCTTTSLSAIDVALPEVSNNFPFLAFNGSPNVSVDQTPNGIIISQTLPVEGVHIGLVNTILTGSVSINPVIFTDTSVVGFYNSGLYNIATGEITIPTTDIYSISVQIISGSATPALDQFSRSLFILVNGSNAGEAYRTSVTNEIMSLNYSVSLLLNVGDVVTVRLSTSSVLPAPYSILPQSYLSFKRLQ